MSSSRSQNGTTAWMMQESGLAGRPEIDISQRLVPREVCRPVHQPISHVMLTLCHQTADVYDHEPRHVGKLQP